MVNLTHLRNLWQMYFHNIKNTKWDFRGAGKQQKQVVLFYRDFRSFTGGHLKVWHYFNHVRYSSSYAPYIVFSDESVWDDTNPWYPPRHEVLAEWNANQADVFFLAGMDWGILSEAQRHNSQKPVINLIQHVRHADPNQPLYQYLTYRAIRICVSEEVTQALRITGKVNGPIFTIPNGIDFTELPQQLEDWENRTLDLLIVGIKQPALATELLRHLRIFNRYVEALIDPIPRADFLKLLGNTKIAVFLPHITEGFYLPAIEGFALGTLVICPDCIGNRTFCLSGQNCLQPSYTVESLLHAVQQALYMAPMKRLTLLESARQTVQHYSLLRERQSFLEILQQSHSIW